MSPTRIARRGSRGSSACPSYAPSPQPAPRLTGAEVKVLSGDAIQVCVGDRVETVRYIGVDAPAARHPSRGEQPIGSAALDLNQRLLDGKVVVLELDIEERDRNGRLLAYVYLGDLMVNAERKHGLAITQCAPESSQRVVRTGW